MSGPSRETVARSVRAFFAPVDRAAGTPTIFDAAMSFDVEAPPSPWIATGEVRNFTRTAGTRFGALACGAKGAPMGQYRMSLEARVTFDFCTWGKLQMAIAGGSQHMNVLAERSQASAAPCGGAAADAVAVLSGSSATELVLGAGAVDAFNVGDMVAVDVDYAQQVGYVGFPVSAAFVRDAEEVGRDRDYLRRVTFNVASIAEKTAVSLILDQALIGGAPAEGTSLQKVVGFVDREGGGYFQEWSAVFVVEAESGGPVRFYYPRLQAAGPASEAIAQLDTFSLQRLHAEMLAMPVKDEVDGEQAVCWRSWLPK